MSLWQRIKNELSPINYCKSFVIRVTEGCVYSGPFKGIRYVNDSVASAYFPKLLGCYEKELHATISQLSEKKYDKVIVLGAAEGYYACGLSRLMNLPVTAYESEEQGQFFINEMAKTNGLEVEVKGSCNPEDLLDFSTYKNLIIMDIEGAEIDFLDKGVMDTLDKSQWIIEVHYWEFLEKMKARFQNKYDLEFIPIQKRTISDFPMPLKPILRIFLKRYLTSLVQEWRTSNSYGWLVMKSHNDLNVQNLKFDK